MLRLPSRSLAPRNKPSSHAEPGGASGPASRSFVAYGHELLLDLSKLGTHSLADWLPPEHEARAAPTGRAIMRVSRPAGFHRRPLAEPSVRLSPHSAPIRQTCRSYRAANVRKDSRFPGQAFRESDPRGSCELQSA